MDNGMFCSKCNTSLSEGVKFCPSCGLEAGAKPGTGPFFSNLGGKVAKVINKETLDAGKEKIGQTFNAGKEKAKAFVDKQSEGSIIHKIIAFLKTVLEKAKALINKLPFRSLAEKKIPAGARAKVPLLEKAIPFANHIVCGLAAFILIIAVGSSGGKNASASAASGGSASSAASSGSASSAASSGSAASAERRNPDVTRAVMDGTRLRMYYRSPQGREEWVEVNLHPDSIWTIVTTHHNCVHINQTRRIDGYQFGKHAYRLVFDRYSNAVSYEPHYENFPWRDAGERVYSCPR